MSSNTQSTMGAQAVDQIDLVGEARGRELANAGFETVEDVANVSATELFQETTGISASQIENIARNARVMLDIDAEPEVELEAGQKFPTAPSPDEADQGDVDVPEKYQEDDEGEDDGPGTMMEMDVDSFLESGPDPMPQPEECENVLLVAGDDAFDVGMKHGDLDAEGQAKLVQRRMIEFGFDPEAIGAMDSGMGRQAVNSWVKYTKQETNCDLPKLVQFSVEAEDYPTRDDYQDRNEKALEWADAVCAVANGDYVGMWVNMARDHNVLIQTPDEDE